MNILTALKKLPNQIWNRYDIIEVTEELFNSVKVNSFQDVMKWNVCELRNFIDSLKFTMGNDRTLISQVFDNQFIDGSCFFSLTQENWISQLLLPSSTLISFHFLSIIRDGLRYGLGLPLSLINKNIPIAVAAGLVSDLSKLPASEALALTLADEQASKSGKGLIYGQLVVLGYKEYRLEGTNNIPLGPRNDIFVLKRRPGANGLKLISSQTHSSSATIPFKSSVDSDLDATHKICFTIPATSTMTTSTKSNGRKLLAKGLRRLVGSGKGGLSSSSSLLPDNRIKKDIEVVLSYSTDLSKDIYQIGRSNSNDFIVKGTIHSNDDGNSLSGPTSRFAARIECERLPPFRSFIFAGGFNEKKEIVIREDCPTWIATTETAYALTSSSSSSSSSSSLSSSSSSSPSAATAAASSSSSSALSLSSSTSLLRKISRSGKSKLKETNQIKEKEKEKSDDLNKLCSSNDVVGGGDALTKFGIRIYKQNKWVEVSVRGRIVDAKRQPGNSPGPYLPSIDNELTNGCLIDLCGVIIQFQDIKKCAQILQHQLQIDPMKVIKKMNESVPTCPVLLSNITFSYTPPHENAKKCLNQLQDEGIGFINKGLITSNISEVTKHSMLNSNGNENSEQENEESRIGVYSDCGHVFSYHSYLKERSCPMCRRSGPFVPLRMVFESSIDTGKISHLFSPCGCVASQEVVTYWSNITLPPAPTISSSSSTSNSNHNPPHIEIRSFCPFCATPLNKSGDNKGFSKLNFQTVNNSCDDVDLDSDDTNRSSLRSFSSDKIDEDEIQRRAEKLLLERELQVIYREQYSLSNSFQQVSSNGSHKKTNNTDIILNQVALQFPKYIPQLKRATTIPVVQVELESTTGDDDNNI